MGTEKWEKFTIEDFKEAIPGTCGIISQIAENLKSCRPTIYKYIEKYPEIRELIQLEKDNLLDSAEFGVTHNIKVRNAKARNTGKAIDTSDHKWALGRLRPEIFGKKVDITSDNKPIIEVDPAKIAETEDKLTEILELLQKAD